MTVCQLVDLLGQVNGTYIEEAATPVHHTARRGRVWLIAAAVAASLTITAAAVAHYLDLSAYLKIRGMEDTSGVEQLSEELTGQECFSNDLAEYKIMDASCDSSLIYLVVEIQAKSQDQMVIPQYVDPGDSVQNLNIEGVTEGSILDYANSIGKAPVYASFAIVSEEIGSTSEDVRCTTEGTMYVYMTAANTTGQQEITLHCTGVAYPADNATVEAMVRSEYDLTIHDRSSRKTLEFTTFDEEMARDLHITPIGLTFEETEMGTLVTLTYRSESEQADIVNYFNIVDAEGEKLLWMPGSDGEIRELPDGTYTATLILQNIPSYEGLRIQFPNHEPYEFSK